MPYEADGEGPRPVWITEDWDRVEAAVARELVVSKYPLAALDGEVPSSGGVPLPPCCDRNLPA